MSKILKTLSISARLIVLLWVASPTAAGPWIDPGDAALRHHLQVLADAGVVRVPLTTYPLMWSGIARDIANTRDIALNDMQRWSLSYVRHELNRQSAFFVMDTRAGIASDVPVMNDFGSEQREASEVGVRGNWLGDYVSVNLVFSVTGDEIDNQQYRLDGSYVAAVLGNWSLSVGAVDRWWGPGWDSSLVLSNNARPVPGVALQRNYSDAFETPLLSWIGPWQMVVFGGQLEGDRAIPDAKLLGMRVTLKPFSHWELGFSRTAQWGGEGRPQSLDSLWDAFTGKDNRGDSGINLDNEPGNQLAGVDTRLSFPLGDTQTALYFQGIGEDSTDLSPSRYMYQAGGEVAWATDNWHNRVFIEGITSEADRGDYFNYAYEHGIYRSGYRYRGRPIGASVDNDTRVISLNGMHQLAAGHRINWKLAQVELNRDGSNAALPGGNVYGEDAVDFTRAELGYKYRLNAKTLLGAKAIYQSEDIRWRDSGEVSGSGAMLTIEHKWKL